MKRVLFFLIFIFPASFTYSQHAAVWTSADMYQGLRKLNVLGSVLYVAAHPDDENTRLLSYFSKERLFRTGYLSMTRGDGGQNLIGEEQGIELGLIRTQELLSARRIDGGEQFFTRAYDFGYSKTTTETFAKWDREKALGDVVYVIRKFRPDIIITRFPASGEGGHGHHTASAILANEAFSAAADPGRFPEQLKYVQTWQAKRIMWNGFNFGGGPPTGNDNLRLDVGGYNPLLGKSYGEIAAESRSQHKSQGFGVAAVRGESIESFRLVAGSAAEKDIMDGVETGWGRVKDGIVIQKKIDSLTQQFDLLNPERSVPGLVKLYQYIQSTYITDQVSKDRNLSDNNNWKNKKIQEIRELILQCSGLFLDATTNAAFAVQTDSIRINFSLNNRLGVDAKLRSVQVDRFDSSFTQTLERNRNFNISKVVYVPLSKPISQPYWLVNKMEEGYFNVKDQTQIGQPDVDPPYVAAFEISIYGEPFVFSRPVMYKHTDPVRGELYQPLFVIPSSTVTTAPTMLLFQKGAQDKQAKTAAIQLNVNRQIQPPVKIELRSQRDLKEAKETGSLARNSSRLYEFKFNLPGNKAPETEKYYSLAHYTSNRDTVDIHKAIRAINYDHIPSVKYFFTDYLKVLNIDLVTYNKRIGYISGAGDKVPEALEQMGYDVVLLGDKELSRNNLAQFDAIITGVRAYNTNEWMNDHYDKLMNYVNEGGNLIVQYNTSSNIGPVRAKIAPYAFNISRARVTDENSPVSFLKPEHAVLNFPNKITTDDFNGWIQERSIYHAADWDKDKFEAILSMNDPGESADPGSLIIAKHGKGFFTYTGLVFFRELPAGVPGAYRLIANIIALNRKKGF